MPVTALSPFAAVRDDWLAMLRDRLPEQVARLSWDRDQIVAHQTRRLRALLAYAAAHSPFHARRLAGITLDQVHASDLSRLPTMRRTEMMNALDDVFTDRRLTCRVVEDALAGAGREPAVPLGRYVALTSGGSSGQRGVFVLDRPGAAQFFGSLARPLAARLAASGGAPPGGLPIAMVAAAAPMHATGLACVLTEGGGLPFRLISVPATLPIAEIVTRLEAINAPGLYGYPSVLAQLAAERRAGRLRLNPVVVTSTSETCTPELRRAITEGFGVPLVDTFGSTEGLVGTSPPGEEMLTFAEDGCIVELVDADGDPVPPGTPSAGVLVTNLENRVQPLIRYRLDDRFEVVSHDGYLRARVRGRSDDTFHYGRVAVHPHVIRAVLVSAAGVLEYQVRQTEHGIAVDAVTSGPVPGLAGLLESALAAAGLPAPRAEVRRVPQLYRDPASAKLRLFLPLCAERATINSSW